MTSNRPRRQRKGDRLVSPNASAAEVQCDYALAPFDRLSLDMERKWGIERLPELVSPATAQKFGSAMAKLNAALDAEDPDEVRVRAEVCIRGLRAMDAEATAAGMPEADPTVWEYDLDGLKIGIMADDKCWQAAKDARPDLLLFSMREVAIALKAHQFDGVVAVKDKFPGAQIAHIRPKQKPPIDWKGGGDEIDL